MSVKKYLEAKPLSTLAKYDSRADIEREAVPFSGTPRKHPYDDEKMLLVLDPFGSNTMFHEFQIDDILHVDDLARLVTESGKNIGMVKIWVKRGSIGMQYQPFEVAAPLKFFRDSEILRQAVSGEG